MTTSRYRVRERTIETADTVTLVLTPLDEPIADPLPGQFTMLYAFGVGEVPISVSGRTGAGDIVHTLRCVGAVTKALSTAQCGTTLGLRGPYGTEWGMPDGGDLIIMAGGIGLAPLRPVIRQAIEQRGRYGSVSVLIGARTPGDLLYVGEHDVWRDADIDVRVTVDQAATGWTGHVGVVTTVLDGVAADPAHSTAFLCGPEVMMRFAARALIDRGMAPDAIRVSLERNMRCGVGLCGHCQLGPVLLCRDGPVIGYDRAAPLLDIKEM